MEFNNVFNKKLLSLNKMLILGVVFEFISILSLNSSFLNLIFF